MAGQTTERATSTKPEPTILEHVATFEKAEAEALQNGDHENAYVFGRLRNVAMVEHVRHFAEEKNAKGELVRPYFNEVQKDIAELITASKQAGRPLTLLQAYEAAVWQNPTLRAKALAANPNPAKKRELSLRGEIEQSFEASRGARG